MPNDLPLDAGGPEIVLEHRLAPEVAADRQTTGGYVKIGTVSTVDLPKLAQAEAGDRVRFLRVGEDEARRLLREYEQTINALRQYIQCNQSDTGQMTGTDGPAI